MVKNIKGKEKVHLFFLKESVALVNIPSVLFSTCLLLPS